MSAVTSLLLSAALALTQTPGRAVRTPPLKDTAALCAYLDSGETNRHDFVLTGTIISVDHSFGIRPYIIIQDDSGCMGMNCDLGNEPQVGDFVTAAGEGCTEFREPWCTARRLTKLGTRPIPQPVRLKLADLADGRYDYQRIIVSGTVIDSFPDDISPKHHLLLLKDNGGLLPLSVSTKAHPPTDNLVNAKIDVCGIFHKSVHGSRKFSGPYLQVRSTDDISVLIPPPKDPFDVPTLKTQYYHSPRSISQQGRRSVSGEVIAVWQQCRLLVRTADGYTVGVSLAHGIKPPPCGTSITAVGHPATDLFNIELTRAIFRQNDFEGPCRKRP